MSISAIGKGIFLNPPCLHIALRSATPSKISRPVPSACSCPLSSHQSLCLYVPPVSLEECRTNTSTCHVCFQTLGHVVGSSGSISFVGRVLYCFCFTFSLDISLLSRLMCDLSRSKSFLGSVEIFILFLDMFNQTRHFFVSDFYTESSVSPIYPMKAGSCSRKSTL